MSSTRRRTVAELPRIISVDDHVLEPPELWTSRLPDEYRDVGPRIERRKGAMRGTLGIHEFVSDDDGDTWADCWVYEDAVVPMVQGFAISGHLDDDDADGRRPILFDGMLPG